VTESCGDGRGVIQATSFPDTEQVLKTTGFSGSEGYSLKGLSTENFSMVKVSPIRMRSAGLLTAGMMFGYAVFLLWAALGSQPDDYKCVFHRSGSQEEVIKASTPSISKTVLQIVNRCVSSHFGENLLAPSSIAIYPLTTAHTTIF
jgi:hypothetical protein